jgi:hypothetical protein
VIGSRHRFIFVAVTVVSTPALASPCTNLQSLQLEYTAITSAADNTSGAFVVPNANPPQTITGLPAFCRVAEEGSRRSPKIDPSRLAQVDASHR